MPIGTVFLGTEILLLEDEPLVNLNTSDMIERMGCTVRSFFDLSSAWASARDLLPDVAILDINLHGETSYEFADWLSEKNVGLLFLTGYDSPDVESRWRDHLVCRKPCPPEELKASLVRVLAVRRPTIQL